MSKQIKLKNMLNENTPGYKDRKFGAPLPTLEDVQKAYENKEELPIEEGNNTQYSWGQINKALMKYGMSPRHIGDFLLILNKI
jgi:hypothetical protein